MNEHDEKKRLYWACRRGMLELDIFLMRYFTEQYDSLTKEKQACFRALLAQPDPDLYSWIMGYQQAEDPQFALLCKEILHYVQQTPSLS